MWLIKITQGTSLTIEVVTHSPSTLTQRVLGLIGGQKFVVQELQIVLGSNNQPS